MSTKKPRRALAPVVHVKKQKRKNESAKGCRKIGRMRSWCQAYRSACRREINRTRRLRRHLKRFPRDLCAAAALASPA